VKEQGCLSYPQFSLPLETGSYMIDITFYLTTDNVSFINPFRKRPYTEDCLEHRWLMSSDYMVRKRERAIFLGSRLKVINFNISWVWKINLMLFPLAHQTFCDEYHDLKNASATSSKVLNTVAGGPTPTQLLRSNSIQEELLTTF